MSRPLTLIGALVVLVLVLVAGLYASRSLMLYEGRTPEGYDLLTAMPAASGFEPKALPEAPILENQSAHDLAANFGYVVGGIPYSYSLEVSFPGPGAEGHATVKVRHATREATIDTLAIRRWDEPRKAYAVAVQGKFDIQPAVPALCIKAVIGPKTDPYDLRDASLCVAQRDVTGACHPETLACGLIR
jgi:hypothetical protein